MSNYVNYLVEANLSLVIFLAVYVVVLRKETDLWCIADVPIGRCDGVIDLSIGPYFIFSNKPSLSGQSNPHLFIAGISHW